MIASTSEQEVEIILLGTGTSGQLPNVSCLTEHFSPDWTEADSPCRTCFAGGKNVRRNTSAVVRGKRPDGSKSTILVDCGKSFLSSALEFFPKFGLRTIDAVLLTHPHADAINGLDDLRGWTLKGVVQPFIKVYCSQHTLEEIASSWPYMVELGKATGGGDVPAFEWVVIDEDKDFVVEGITVTPLNVHHGRFFSPPPAPGTPPPAPNSEPPPILPFYCLGFIFNPSIIYLSDVSFIPHQAWAKLLPTVNTRKTLTSSLAEASLAGDVDMLPTPPYSPPTTPPGVLSAASSSVDSSPRWPVLILDTLFLRPHTSHFGILAALQTILRLNPVRTYLTGFAHHHSHEEWVALGEELDGTRAPGVEEAFIAEAASISGEVGEEARRRGVWVRPGFDGLRVTVDAKGEAREEGPEGVVFGGKGLELEVGRGQGGLATPPMRAQERSCCCP